MKVILVSLNIMEYKRYGKIILCLSLGDIDVQQLQ